MGNLLLLMTIIIFFLSCGMKRILLLDIGTDLWRRCLISWLGNVTSH